MIIDGIEAEWIKPSYAVTADGQVWSFVHSTPRRLRLSQRPKGYLSVALGASDKNHFVHRLVARAFHGPCPPGMEVRHLDGNPANNHKDNLAYGTRSQNRADSRRLGRLPLGSEHHHARLDEAVVLTARRLWTDGLTLRQIIAQLGLDVSRAGLHDAIIGRTWNHLHPDGTTTMEQP